MRPLQLVLVCAAALVTGSQSFGQAVISARSGVVHYFEGSVSLDNQRLDHKFASFPNIKEGSSLRTEQGRAEVLLTPGVFLRMDEDSAIRMRSTALSDTQVDFLQGALIVDSLDSLADNHVTVWYKDSAIRFPKQGVYRLDFETGTVQAYSGEAAIEHDGKRSTVDDSHLFFLTLDLTTNKLDTGTDDEFYDWARDRSDAISAENEAAAQANDDSGDQDADPNALAGPLPNYGTPNYGLPGPNIGGMSVPNYPLPDYGYALGSPLFNPFGPYAAGFPYMPYTAFPVFVLVRPYGGYLRWLNAGGKPGSHPGWTGTHPPWNGTTTRPGWTRTGSVLGSYPSWNRTYHLPSVRVNVPTYHPMPSAVRPAYSRPAVIARPMSAPARAIGHR